MKGIILFGKGLGRAIKDSWVALIVLLITSIAGIAGVNFCYRMAFFEIRQPENSSEYNNTFYTAYHFNGNVIGDMGEILEVGGNKLVGIIGAGNFMFNDDVVHHEVFSEDYYKEGYLTSLDFQNGVAKVVINDDIVADVGSLISINNISYEVAGKTDKTTYMPLVDNACLAGGMIVFTHEQLTRGEMSECENILGVKLGRDYNWTGTLQTQSYFFIVMGVIILILSAINIYKVFGLYINKNSRRYTIYGMLGMTKLRSSSTILLEGSIFLAFMVPLGLAIDTFLFRPLVKILGYTFMYDFADIAISFFLVIIPFVLAMASEIFKRYSTSVGDKKLLSRKV